MAALESFAVDNKPKEEVPSMSHFAYIFSPVSILNLACHKAFKQQFNWFACFSLFNENVSAHSKIFLRVDTDMKST